MALFFQQFLTDGEHYWEKNPKQHNSKNTENEKDFQCNWLTSDRASFSASHWEKKSYFSRGHVSGEENRVPVCYE